MFPEHWPNRVVSTDLRKTKSKLKFALSRLCLEVVYTSIEVENCIRYKTFGSRFHFK